MLFGNQIRNVYMCVIVVIKNVQIQFEIGYLFQF